MAGKLFTGDARSLPLRELPPSPVWIMLDRGRSPARPGHNFFAPYGASGGFFAPHHRGRRLYQLPDRRRGAAVEHARGLREQRMRRRFRNSSPRLTAPPAAARTGDEQQDDLCVTRVEESLA